MAADPRSPGNLNNPSAPPPPPPPPPSPPPPYAPFDTSSASDPSDLSASANLPAKLPPQIPQPADTNSNSNNSPSPAPPLRSRAVSSASVRRKPLPLTASHLATRYSSGEHLASTIERPEESLSNSRPFSADSPTLYEFPSTSTLPFTPARSSLRFSKPSNEHAAPSLDAPSSESATTAKQTTTDQSSNLAVPSQAHGPLVPAAEDATLASDSALSSATESAAPWSSHSSSNSLADSATMSIFSSKPPPPHTINVSSPPSRSYSEESSDSHTTIQKPQPKSPGGSKLGSFFGWGGSASPASSTTTFSENPYSPLPSPSPSPQTPDHPPTPSNASKPTTRNPPTAIDIPKANASAESYFGNAHLQLPLATPSSPIQVEEMEKELKDISSELAASIRREMDLEDLVERLQSEVQNSSGGGKRTSDYFSDSGTTASVAKYGEVDTRQEELDRMIRRTEQEKAQMRLELTEKVQDERARRKYLEAQIRSLEEKASHVDLASMNSIDANGRLKDLEATCEDLRRRLAGERQMKENFEDLLTALKGELQDSLNERDNLRDEIVPQLRARVEGLEAQAAQHEKLTYEQSKMQQELQTLKDENVSLINAQKQQKRFSIISEEIGNAPVPTRSRPPSLTRSTSVKTTESREALAERVKDIELQRDALHRALKSLLERQEHQNRENQKKIRQLEIERDRALSSSPRRLAYDKEVATLREEINTLRRRADEAIEQKWQCEKGLSGLKMDLERAEQEIGSLRNLLQENDILIPATTRLSSGSIPESGQVSSESLEQAYRDLQKEYTASLERVKALELSGPKDEETMMAMKQLEQSLADAISERDFARQDAEAFREQAEDLRQSETAHVSNEVALAEELRSSAKRVEELAAQVRQQLASNATLRQRLAETVERGEKEQRANASKIMALQSRLKSLEDQLMAAQQNSEEAITRHEEEIRGIKENNNVQLQRMRDGMRSPRMFASQSAVAPMFANSTKAPRISLTTSGKAKSVSEDSNMELLRQRVVELESALAEADKQMEDVVGRMNVAQVEVMNLQNEREEAVRATRKLQKVIEEAKLRKAF